MNTKTDQQLLQEYADKASEAAFTELARRYVDLVYSAALRMVQDAYLAQDISQEVFLALARSAASLTDRAVLAGWLHRTTHHLAVKAIRMNARRRVREHEAMAMNEISSSEPEAGWEPIALHLDGTLNELNEAEREAVLLRYFERKSAREMAEALAISEEAAQKRVSRAVEKLRDCFARKGVKVEAAGLVSLIAAHAVQPAPAVVVAALGNAVAQKANLVALASRMPQPLSFSVAQKIVLTAAVMSLIGMAGYQFSRKAEPHAESAERVINSPAETDTVGAKPSPVAANPSRSPIARQTGRPGDKNLAELKERLRATLYKPWPSKYGVRSYPPDEVVGALMAFGADRKEAIGTLLEAAQDADPEVRQRAVSAMGLAGMPPTPAPGKYAIQGEPASELRPFLWNLLRANDKELSHLALISLRNIGFESNEIPALADLLSHTKDDQLFRYLPEAIAKTILQNSDAATPHIRGVEGLLDHEDPNVQFAAACALANSEAGRNPKVLERMIAGLKDKKGLNALMALETLATVGRAAEPALQDILSFAESAEDAHMKKLAYKAIGKIREDLRSQFPEVEQGLKEEEMFAKWNEKFAAGNLTYKECVEALKIPTFAAQAAKKLSAMGATAKSAIPDLLAGLAGQDQLNREEIVKVIHEIDPTVAIEKVNREAVDTAALMAYMEISSKPDTNERKKALELLTVFRMGGTDWYTRQEVATAARSLAVYYPKIQEAFVTQLVEKEPALAVLFDARVTK